MLDVSRGAGCCLVTKSKGFGLEQMAQVGESGKMAVESPSHIWHVVPLPKITLSRDPSVFLSEGPYCSVW